MPDAIRPVDDFVFRYIFGSENNRDLLLSLLNSFLTASGRPEVREIEVKNPFNLKEWVADKESILDIKAKAGDGTWFDVEMQAGSVDQFPQRSLYYWARLYANQLSQGYDYRDPKPVVCIAILDRPLFGLFDKAFSAWKFRTDRAEDGALCEDALLCFLELPKLVEKASAGLLDQWAKFLKFEGMDDGIVTELASGNPDIAKAHQVFKDFTEDEILREKWEAHHKWLLARTTEMNIARERAMAEGLAKGRLEGQVEVLRSTAKRMKNLGIPITTIMAATGLPEDELLGL